MTHDEATAAAKRLGAEHPDRDTHTWIAREIDREAAIEAAAGGWEVVKIRLPGGVRRDRLKATTEAKPKPQQSDDVPVWRSAGGVPPYVGPG
jgi:hypothetical protein